MITAALAIHAPRCKQCIAPVAECDGRDAWRKGTGSEHDPEPECTVCVRSWGDEETELWPCPTVAALHGDAPKEETPRD